MRPSKKHGLWRFHRAVTAFSARCEEPIRWWTPEGIGFALDIQNEALSKAGLFSMDDQMRVTAVLVRCAYRYMRRKKVLMTVGNFSATCYEISRRAGGIHHAALNAALRHCEGVRKKAPLKFYDEFTPPTSRGRSCYELRQRLERFIEYRNRLCCVCEKRDSVPNGAYLEYAKGLTDDLFPLLRRTRGEHGGFVLCWPCWMRLCKLVKAHNVAEETIRSINKTKRKIYEATKVNA